MVTVTITNIPTITTTTAAAVISITERLIGSFHSVGLVLGVDSCCTEAMDVGSCTEVLDVCSCAGIDIDS